MEASSINNLNNQKKLLMSSFVKSEKIIEFSSFFLSFKWDAPLNYT